MNKLFKIYDNKSVKGNNEETLFTNFFSDETNRNNVEHCLDLMMSNEQLKDDIVANKLRCEGNVLYKSRKFTESLHKYTLALCNALPGSETYGIILANRSAVFFMMKRYTECLSDIDNCLRIKCPDAVSIKVYIRKIKCCYNTNLCEHKNVISAALDYVNNSNVPDKSILEAEIKSYCDKVLPSEIVAVCPNQDEEVPDVKLGFNNSFLYASSAVSLKYDKQRGRHVRSNTRINPGDVLFVEKPFIFAPVFTTSNMELHFNKCYNCLRTIYASVPCEYCIKCVFCNENCRKMSWNEFHKWECRGMRSNLWYHIGIAFPALRVLLRGTPTGLAIPVDDYESDIVKFGNEEDGYLYFNKLLTNIEKMTNVLPLILCASIVITYLQKYTDFFQWLLKQPSRPKNDSADLVMYIGALLVRHIAQLQCNSSVIKHVDLNCEDDSVACAIYPSVSMMNHSCKPNITMLYLRDLVVVRASEVIAVDEEVFNCYGIDYRYLDRSSRQEQCLSLYYFKCECRACKNHMM